MHWAVADTTKDNRNSCGSLSYRMLSKLLVLLQAILLMSGCAAFMGFPTRVTDRSKDLEALQKHIDADAITECLKATNEAEACRNKLITSRTYAIDIQFSAFEEDLFRQAREAGFARHCYDIRSHCRRCSSWWRHDSAPLGHCCRHHRITRGVRARGLG